jgi:phage anti-repressor protein
MKNQAAEAHTRGASHEVTALIARLDAMAHLEPLEEAASILNCYHEANGLPGWYSVKTLLSLASRDRIAGRRRTPSEVADATLPPFNMEKPALPAPSIETVEVKLGHIGGEEVLTVDGRTLHTFLAVGKVFAAWIQERIEQYKFAEGSDFEVFSETGKNPSGGRPTKEYTLSLDMAKELAMVERTPKGKEARQYFLQCEKRALAAGRRQWRAVAFRYSLPMQSEYSPNLAKSHGRPRPR